MHAVKIFFILIPKLSHLFGYSNRETLFLLFQFWYFAVSRKTFFRGKEMQFTLCYKGKKFQLWIESIVDLAVLDEVFLKEEYSWELQSPPKFIIDLGAHFGDTALYYHFTYPEATIFAIEPAPETYARLCKNVRAIPSIVPVQVAVSDTNGFADLHVSASSIGASFSTRTDSAQVVSVPMCTLRSLLVQQGIERVDLIKFDIEGAEELLFVHDSPETFSDAYIGEVHGDLMKQSCEEFVSSFIKYTVQTEPMKNTQRFIVTCVKK